MNLQVYWHILNSRLICGPACALAGSLLHRIFSLKTLKYLHVSILSRTYLIVYKLSALMQDAQIDISPRYHGD